jgi:hypothetical protein
LAYKQAARDNAVFYYKAAVCLRRERQFSGGPDKRRVNYPQQECKAQQHHNRSEHYFFHLYPPYKSF